MHLIKKWEVGVVRVGLSNMDMDGAVYNLFILNKAEFRRVLGRSDREREKTDANMMIQFSFDFFWPPILQQY